MKPILLLGPAQPGGLPQERWLVELRRATPAEEALDAAGGFSAVIVVNDGGARTFRRMLTALDMRENCEDLWIGVLSYLEERGKRAPALINIEPRLKLELKDETLRLEYQAV